MYKNDICHLLQLTTKHLSNGILLCACTLKDPNYIFNICKQYIFCQVSDRTTTGNKQYHHFELCIDMAKCCVSTNRCRIQLQLPCQQKTNICSFTRKPLMDTSAIQQIYSKVGHCIDTFFLCTSVILRYANHKMP